MVQEERHCPRDDHSRCPLDAEMRAWGECLVKFRTCSLAIPYAFLRMNVPRVIAGLKAENVQLSTVLLADCLRHDVLDAPPRVSVAQRRNLLLPGAMSH
jgi:hypothetical protein